jgi:hypothetical protein
MDDSLFISNQGTGTRMAGSRRTTSGQIAETADRGENSHGVSDLCNQTVLTANSRTKDYPKLARYYQLPAQVASRGRKELLAIQLLAKSAGHLPAGTGLC